MSQLASVFSLVFLLEYAKDIPSILEAGNRILIDLLHVVFAHEAE